MIKLVYLEIKLISAPLINDNFLIQTKSHRSDCEIHRFNNFK